MSGSGARVILPTEAWGRQDGRATTVLRGADTPTVGAVPRRSKGQVGTRRRFVRLLKREPVQIQGLVQAAMALLISMGLPLSDAVKGEVLAFSAAFLALYAKQHVTPVARPRDRRGRVLRAAP